MVDVNNVTKRKRKSACQDIIFEVNDNDFSPEASPQPADTFDTCGPDSKLPRCDQPSSLESNLDSGFSQQSVESIPVSDDVPLNELVEDGEINETSECDYPDKNKSMQDTTTIEISQSNNDTLSACITCEFNNKNDDNLCSVKTVQNDLDVRIEIESKTVTGNVDEVQMDGTSECNSPDKNVQTIPSIRITFKDDIIAKSYKHSFLKFLHSFVEFDIKALCDNELNIDVELDSAFNQNDWVVLDENQINQTPTKKHHKKSKNKAKKELFMLDTTPNIIINESKSLQYSTKFSLDSGQKADAVNEVKFVSNQSCFNCNEKHSLKDCPHPKNFVKINMARQKFKSNQSKSLRYHLEEDQKYAHLVPGKISDNLRKALGLRRKELPPYIYLMRVLGYPPGWIQEASVVHSNLSMFGSDGLDVNLTANKKSRIDPNKIIEYPGFNVPLEDGVKDDYMMYNVPQHSEQFSKEAMLDYIKRLDVTTVDNLEICDMEVDKESDILMGPDGNLNENCKLRSKSPSLNDLEKEKEQLLSQLSNSDDEQKVNSKEADLSELEKGNCTLNSSPIVKTSCLGTPILKSSSPYITLPKPENFSVDVSPVINFENLPNSTGKYEQMTGVLQKVRNTLKHLQNETL